jgi:hypothetical protein
MCMGGDERDYDSHCESCGAGYYFEVGFQITCDSCGGSLIKQKPMPQEIPDDSAFLDPDFMNFDEEKAFKYMKEHGLLHHAYRVEPDPVQDFLDAVDGPGELFFASPGTNIRSMPLTYYGKNTQLFNIPKSLINP